MLVDDVARIVPAVAGLVAAAGDDELVLTGQVAEQCILYWSPPAFVDSDAGPSGLAARISVHACAVSVGVPP